MHGKARLFSRKHSHQLTCPECIRREVSARLTRLNIPKLYIPSLTSTPPPQPQTHLPIHSTPPELLRTKKRVIVLVNRSHEDLAILSYRVLSKSGGINAGSAIDLVTSIQSRATALAAATGRDVEDATPGIVILNPGQTYFSHKQNRALTQTSWMALPRQSAVHPPVQAHETHNRVTGNTTLPEHVAWVFEHLLDNADFVDPQADLYIIGLCEGADTVVQYLQAHPGRHHVAAIATTGPVPVLPATSALDLTPDAKPFLEFLSKRARCWRLSTHELNVPLANPTPAAEIVAAASDKSSDEAFQEVALFPMLSGGEEHHAECIITSAWPKILDWFEEVAFVGGSGESGVGKAYENELLGVSEEVRMDTLNLRVQPVVEW